jgi:hypothetical protein
MLRASSTRRIERLAEGFNITDYVSFVSYNCSMQSWFFGWPQSARDPRQIQPGARFDF